MTRRARSLRNTMTDAERALWAMIRGDRFGLRFRRQVVFDQRYILDFYAPSLRLAIEVDGGQHADSVTDDQRTTHLNQRGVNVLRFWNNEVLAERDAVLATIGHVMAALTPASPPSPLPAGEGGDARAGGDAPSRSRTGVRGEAILGLKFFPAFADSQNPEIPT